MNYSSKKTIAQQIANLLNIIFIFCYLTSKRLIGLALVYLEIFILFIGAFF